MRFFELIAEARDYSTMFSSMIANWPDEWRKDGMSRSVNDYIQRSRTSLKRSDRIMWFLSHVKFSILENYILSRDEDDVIPPWIQKQFNKLKTRFGYKPSTDLFFPSFDPEKILQELEHYLSLPAPGIQNYTFENQNWQTVHYDMEYAENEWKQSLKGAGVAIQEGDKKLIGFDDGLAWWLLARGACDQEGESMGHCGNAPSEQPGDQILSLRSQVGDEIWKPHLTFILNNNGRLGEMKGRGNKKPAPKYYPHIFKLLKHDIIHSVIGGGYMPESNFSLSDLDSAQLKELAQLKPSLFEYLPVEQLLDLYSETGIMGPVSYIIKKFPTAIQHIPRSKINQEQFISLLDFAVGQDGTVIKPHRQYSGDDYWLGYLTNHDQIADHIKQKAFNANMKNGFDEMLSGQDWFEQNSNISTPIMEVSYNDLFHDLSRDDVPETLYHGTSTALGLDVGDQLLSPQHSERLSELGRKKNLDRIFLTPDRKYARIYAGRSVRQFGGEPIVYTVKPVGAQLFSQSPGNEIWTADGGYIVDKD